MIRIGVIGAAKITNGALLKPARHTSGVEVHAIAARNVERARDYSTKHGIPKVHTRYEDLLDDPDIDAVYIPLPAALHAKWTVAAIEAGKHVLCEKPFTANADEASWVETVARNGTSVVMEAYHSGHHPTLQQLREILGSGVLGPIVKATAAFCVLIPPGKDIRWNAELGGGGLLDVGYYPLRLLRDLFGEPHVLTADALQRGGIDREMTALLEFPGQVRGEIVSSIWSRKLFALGLKIHGEDGDLTLKMPYHSPNLGRIRVAARGSRFSERTDQRSTYSYQLESFRDAILGIGANSTGPAEAVLQMTAIDRIYRAAGMKPRSYTA